MGTPLRVNLRPWLTLGLTLLLTGCSTIAPLAPLQAAQPASVLMPTARPIPTPGPGVADILADPPAPGTSFELDAYYSGTSPWAHHGPPPPPDATQALCPSSWGAALTDQPFQALLSVLNSTCSNGLPADGAWLVAVTPEMATPGVRADAQLPYHARLRGHLADPAFAHCPDAARTFMVEAVVQVYEQDPPAMPQGWPEGYASWPRHHEETLGYSLPFPPGWTIERLDGGVLALAAPEWPGYPVTVVVHEGETYVDQYDPATTPSLLQGNGWSVFEQGLSFGAPAAGSQGLAGYHVDRSDGAQERMTSVLLSGNGHTYELSLRYPLGFDAPQTLLTAYSAIVEGFRLDTAPGPSPTPPVRQALGPGPLLTQEEAMARVRSQYGPDVELLFAELVPEAEARQQGMACATYMGHSDGVWLLAVRGAVEGAARVTRLYLDATSGAQLCGEEIDPSTLPTPTPTPTPPPTATPTPPPKPVPTPRPAVYNPAPGERWIEVILSEQALIAWEGETEVRRMVVSTGLPGTPTVSGRYHIYLKALSRRMTGPGYDLPNVPHVLFFYLGYAIHGAYWHDNFGTPMSHGCVNLKLDDAAWIFDWAGPELPAGASAVYASESNPGTLVVVH